MSDFSEWIIKNKSKLLLIPDSTDILNMMEEQTYFDFDKSKYWWNRVCCDKTIYDKIFKLYEDERNS